MGAVAVTYAAARIFDEFFREPDIDQGLFFGWLTKGQLLTVPMLLAGIALGVWARNRPLLDRPALPANRPRATPHHPDRLIKSSLRRLLRRAGDAPRSVPNAARSNSPRRRWAEDAGFGQGNVSKHQIVAQDGLPDRRDGRRALNLSASSNCWSRETQNRVDTCQIDRRSSAHFVSAVAMRAEAAVPSEATICASITATAWCAWARTRRPRGVSRVCRMRP